MNTENTKEVIVEYREYMIKWVSGYGEEEFKIE